MGKGRRVVCSGVLLMEIDSAEDEIEGKIADGFEVKLMLVARGIVDFVLDMARSGLELVAVVVDMTPRERKSDDVMVAGKLRVSERMGTVAFVKTVAAVYWNVGLREEDIVCYMFGTEKLFGWYQAGCIEQFSIVVVVNVEIERE